MSGDDALVGKTLQWAGTSAYVPASVLAQLGLGIAVHETFDAAGTKWVLVCGAAGGAGMMLPGAMPAWGIDLVRRLVEGRADVAHAQHETAAQAEDRADSHEARTTHNSPRPADGDFVLCVQPMFEVRTRAVTRAEVFLRYDQPGRGLLAWPDFAPAQTETQMQAGRWAMEQVIARAQMWHQRYGIAAIHVNATLDTSGMPAVVEFVKDLSATDRALLAVEFPATLSAQETQSLARTVESLGELHVAAGVDLCEVTTASLPLLSELPLRFVKIRSEEAAYAPLETLPWDVCLTHVQLAPDWENLRERGIKYVQGYALEPPITIADFERRMDVGYSAIVAK